MSEAPLEIKPGKYRTRCGEIARIDEVTESGPIGAINGLEGYEWFPGGKTLKDGSPQVFDLIERIEDEKAEDKCTVKLQKYEYVCGIDLADSRTDMSTATLVPVFGAHSMVGNVIQTTETTPFTNEKKYSEADHQFGVELVAMRWSARAAELEAKIAKLEAENESLSRQLRSRKINEKPVSTGKLWRWSPMI